MRLAVIVAAVVTVGWVGFSFTVYAVAVARLRHLEKQRREVFARGAEASAESVFYDTATEMLKNGEMTTAQGRAMFGTSS